MTLFLPAKTPFFLLTIFVSFLSCRQPGFSQATTGILIRAFSTSRETRLNRALKIPLETGYQISTTTTTIVIVASEIILKSLQSEVPQLPCLS